MTVGFKNAGLEYWKSRDLTTDHQRAVWEAELEIFKAGVRPTKKASSEWFTGTVWQDPIVTAREPARVRAMSLAFEPGALTAWHTHPLGQTLHAVNGSGLVGTRTGSPKQIKAGDTVWIPPGEEHWQGASPTNGRTHVAIQEALEGLAAN